MTQLELGMALKAKGKASAAKRHCIALDAARKIARELAQYGIITADDVQEVYQRQFGDHLGNVAGSIFDGDEWESVGYRPSTRPSRHGGLLRIWKLR